jgi:lysophospholipase L1-like esterase
MNMGGNDCDFNWANISANPGSDFEPNTPLSVFEDSYRKVIGKLKSLGIVPILTTLPPLDPQRFFDWFCKALDKDNVMTWLGSVSTIYRHHENYSRTVERIASEQSVPIIDLRGAFLRHRHIEHLLCADGTHPNTEGQVVMTGAFAEFAERFTGGGRTLYA